jgi:hypothetical protein
MKVYLRSARRSAHGDPPELMRVDGSARAAENVGRIAQRLSG